MRTSERTRLTELMARLADGERAAFDPVFEMLWPVLRAYAVRMIGPEEGEDVAQQALLKLFARASEYDPGRDALAWALGITTWECRTARRRQSRSRERCHHPLPDPADPSPSACPETHAHGIEMRAALGAALEELSETDREFLLAELQGQEHTAKPATVRKRRQRALARLRSVWGLNHE